MKIKITKIHKLAVIITTLFLFLTACNQNKTIPIKAALVYKMGAQPVARTKFYLLKEDLEVIKKKVDSAYHTPSEISMRQRLDIELGGTGRYGDLESGINENSIKEYVVATATTDFEGNAKFENVPVGTYFIAGYSSTRSKSGFVVWNAKIDAQTVNDVVLLDQNNALEVEN